MGYDPAYGWPGPDGKPTLSPQEQVVEAERLLERAKGFLDGSASPFALGLKAEIDEFLNRHRY